MTRQSPPLKAPANLLEGSPDNATFTSNMDRLQVTGNLACLTSAVLTTVALPLQAGDVVTNLTFVSATTAANGPTHCFFALYSPAGALLAQTADATTTAWGANTARTLALATPQLITTAGVYYAGICVVASSAVPTLAGATALHNAIFAGNLGSLGYKVLAQTSDSSLVATAPATIGTPTTIATIPFVVAT